MGDIMTLLDAVTRGDSREVHALLNADPALAHGSGEHAKTALHWAAECDQLEVARTLLDAGADIEAATSWGATPLSWAATVGSARVAELLLAHGASGYTLPVAAALGRLGDVERMLRWHADLTAHRRPSAGRLPNDEWPADSVLHTGDVLGDALYSAARNGHGAVVERLLGAGARVDAKGFFGGTALHWAAINGHAATVELLLERGADTSLTDARFAGTPEDWALEGGHAEIATTIRGHRGPVTS